MDGRLIFLHHWWRSEDTVTLEEKGTALLDMGGPQGRGHLRFRSPWNYSREKPRVYKASARTKTDTGRREEYSQALERTLVKELGKLTP
jgi:hypothetical protein